jgi:hypothetical protein
MKPIVVIISFLLSSLLFGQETDKVPNTGDVELDNYISDINTRAKDDYDGFKSEMTSQFGISASEVDRYVKQEKMNPGDLYYGYSLSRETKKPVSDVMKRYKNNKAWGKVAQDLGIKPGSEEFKNFKGKTLKGKNSSVDKNKEENKSQNKNQNQIQKQNQNNVDKAPNTNSKSKK